mmetsp:Transcript_76523/g.216352  ORF Transcript_76523/g.216352 Transcript_76523/m.216352 type:complete len:777 (+) Transcript_76523:98-2428(+)
MWNSHSSLHVEENEVQTSVALLLAAIEREAEESASQVSSLACLRNYLCGDKARWRWRAPLGQPESLERLKRKNLEDVINRTFERKSTELAVVFDALQTVEQASTPQDIIKATKRARVVLNIGQDGVDSGWLAAYRRSLRIRLAYFFLMCLSLALAVFSGGLMQLMFTIFVNVQQPTASSSPSTLDVGLTVVMWSLPFTMIFLSLIGDELTDLFFDAVDDPPLTRFQALLLGSLHQEPKRPPSEALCRCVDAYVLGALEVLPLGVALLTMGPQQGFFYSYAQGGVISALVLAFTFMAADLFVGACSLGIGQDAGDAQDTVDLLHLVIDESKIFPGCLAQKQSYMDLHMNTERSEYGGTDIQAEKVHRFARLGNFIAVGAVLSWTVICLFVHLRMLPMPMLLLGFFAIVLGLSVVIVHRLPGVVGNSYFAILGLFACLATALLISGIDVVMPATGIEPIMVAPGGAAGGNASSLLPSSWRGGEQPYATCKVRWGSSEAPLSSLDMASLAYLVYEPDCSRIPSLLRASFPAHAGAKVGTCTDYNTIPRWVSIYFPPMQPGGEGTLVIAVKGTSTLSDGFIDSDLFATIKVMQAFNSIEPILSLLPRETIQWIIQRLHAPVRGSAEEARIWLELKRDVQALRETYTNDKLVLTGHSLGGGIAQIVAADLDLPALVFSAPGLVFSARRFGVSVAAAHRSNVVVVPDGDIVPRVDDQAGVVQHIACREKYGAPASALGCHSLVKTTCELWRVCGDALGRDFSASCAGFLDRGDLGRVYDIDG